MPYLSKRSPGIYYETCGPANAPWLVMIRGLGRCLLHWEPVVDGLSQRFRLLLVDNRGVGRSDAVLRPFNTLDMANDIVAAMDDAGIERAHLFGMSLGGMVAQSLALAHPERIERLVLGCTSPGGREAVRPKMAALAKVVRARVRGPVHACRAEAEWVLSDSFRAQHPEVIDDWVEIANRYPVTRTTMFLQVLAAVSHRSYGGLPDIAMPTLVLGTDVDCVIPPENNHILARRIPRAQLAWIAGAGHDFATERPDETISVLSEFLLNSH